MISNTYSNSILNAIFRVLDSISIPSTPLYLDLCSTEPDAANEEITKSKEIHFPTARTA